MKGDWWEVRENEITVLRTNTEKVQVVYDSAGPNPLVPDYLILTQLNLQKRINSGKDFVLGTLNSFSRKHHTAYSSALVLLEKSSLRHRIGNEVPIDESLIKKISQSDNLYTQQLADIRYFLYEQKVSLIFNSDNDRIPFSNEVEEIKKFAGYYRMYYLEEDQSQLNLKSIFIEICTDGRVLNELQLFKGFVKYVNTVKGPTWRIKLDLNEEDHFYEWELAIEASQQYGKKILKGVFLVGGYGLPHAGKVFIESVDNLINKPTEKYDPDDAKWENSELGKFFSFGTVNNYLPAYRQLIVSKVKPLPEFLRNKYLVVYITFVYEGNLDSKRRYIFRRINLKRMPLKLIAGSVFELQVGIDEVIMGNYEIANDKLIFTARGSSLFERFSFSLYGTDASKVNFQYAFGISSGFNRSQNCEARAAMLVSVPEEEARFKVWEGFEPEEEARSKVREGLEPEEEGRYKAWEGFDNLLPMDGLSEQSKKAITFLHTGRFNRIVHIPSKLNFDMKPAFDNTRRSLFYSAVHVWNNRDKHSVKEWDKEFYDETPELLCIEYLRKALIRGFAVPEFLGRKRGASTYPQELRIDHDLLLDFISAIENESFKNEIIKLFDLNC